VVMYLGKVAEIAPKADLYRNPKHPYTGTLLSAVPIPDPERGQARQRVILQGDVPSPIDPPPGCPFHPRCPKAIFPLCQTEMPLLRDMGEGHVAACHFPLTGPDDLLAAAAVKAAEAAASATADGA